MRALVVSSKFNPEYSGSGYRAENTYNRLKSKYGINYDFIVSSALHRDSGYYEWKGLKILRITGPFLDISHSGNFVLKKVVNFINMMSQGALTLFFLLRNYKKYDYVHTFGNSWAGTFSTIFFGTFGKPVFRELCNTVDTPYYPRQFKWLLKLLLNRKKSLIISISEMLEEVCKEFGVSNIWTRPNPVDESKFSLEVREKRKESLTKYSKFSSDDIVLVYVANFRLSKNQEFLVRVMKYLPLNFKLILAGPLKPENEPYYEEVLKSVSGCNLDDRVQVIPGFINSVENYYSMADVYLFPTKEEALGTPMLEVQLCGIPIVAGLIPGVTDSWIVDGESGVISNFNQPEIFAKDIIRALKIDRVKLQKNANRLSDSVSTKFIDSEYLKYIQKYCYLG